MKKTLMQEIDEVRAMATPRGQLAIDWLLMLAKQSDEFHGSTLFYLGLIRDELPNGGELLEMTDSLLRHQEKIGDVLARPFQAP